MFSLLNDVTLTIQIMTLKIVTNIINLSHGFPHVAFVFLVSYSHCNAAGVTIPVKSTMNSKSCLKRGFFGRMSISPTSLLKYFIIVEPSSGYFFAGLG